MLIVRTRLVGLCAIAPLALSVTGCFFDEAVPRGSQLTCAATADCPAGLECKLALGLCVPASDDDVAPALTAAARPTALRRGRELEVTISSNEPLLRAPTLTLTQGGVELAFDRIEEAEPVDGAAQTWRATRVTQDDDEEGVALLSVEALDRAGNAGTQIVDVVTFDFTAPALAPVAPGLPDIHVVRPGDSLALAVTFDEAVAGAQLRLRTTESDTGVLLDPVAITGDVVRFIVNVPDPPSGRVLFTVEGATDLAGNVAASLEIGGRAVDGVAPLVTLQVADAARRFSAVAGHNVIALDLVAQDASPIEQLDVRLGPLPFTCQRVDAPLVVAAHCTLTLLAPIGDGGWLITAVARDIAGNTGFASEVVTLDFTAPTLVGPADERLVVPARRMVTPTTWSMLTSLRVQVGVSEPLGAEPLLTLVAPLSMRGTFTGAVGLQQQFLLDPPPIADACAGAPCDGPLSATLTLEDDVGNRAELDLPLATHLDTRPPTLSADALVYTRAPWGSDATELVPTFGVRDEAAATEPHTTLVFFDGPVPALASEIGRTRTDATGRFAPLTLARADRERIYALAVDDAGNESADGAALVHTVEWTAGFGGELPGDDRINPHSFDARGYATARNRPATRAFGPEVARPDGAVALTAPHARLRRISGRSPEDRLGAGLVLDPTRGQLMLWGGSVSDTLTTLADDTVWLWDGVSWSPLLASDPEADGNPAPRAFHALVFDPRRGNVLLVGGSGDSFDLDDCWEWTGQSWRRLPFTAPQTLGLWDWGFTPVSYVERSTGRARLVTSNGVWELSAADEWVQIAALPLRWATWDPARAVLLAESGAHTLAIDANGAATVIAPQLPRSPSYETWGAAFDSTRGVLVGYNGEHVFELVDGAWVQRTPNDPEQDGNPPPRQYMRLMTGPDGHLVLYGSFLDGNGGGAWSWRGTSWRRLADERPIPRLRTANAAFDPARAQVVITGSETSEQLVTFEIGRIAGKRHPEGLDARVVYASSFVTPGVTAYLPEPLGGALRTWNGSSWVHVPLPCALPAVRDALVGFEGVMGTVSILSSTQDLRVGGADSTCFANQLSLPPSTDGGALATVDNNMVLVSTSLGTLGVWRTLELHWIPVDLTDPEGDGNPEARVGHHVVEAGAGMTWLVGGRAYNDLRPLDEIWRLHASSFERIPVDERAGAALGGIDVLAAATSPEKSAWLLAGPRTPGQETVSDRLLALDAPARAEHVARFDLGAVRDGDILIERVHVAGRAGAGAGASAGARLSAWDGMAWRPVAINSAPSATPADLAADVPDVSARSALLQADGVWLRIDASNTGAVTTDWLEIVLRYRIED